MAEKFFEFRNLRIITILKKFPLRRNFHFHVTLNFTLLKIFSEMPSLRKRKRTEDNHERRYIFYFLFFVCFILFKQFFFCFCFLRKGAPLLLLTKNVKHWTRRLRSENVLFQWTASFGVGLILHCRISFRPLLASFALRYSHCFWFVFLWQKRGMTLNKKLFLIEVVIVHLPVCLVSATFAFTGFWTLSNKIIIVLQSLSCLFFFCSYVFSCCLRCALLTQNLKKTFFRSIFSRALRAPPVPPTNPVSWCVVTKSIFYFLQLL